jgi:hypothetical protein
MPPGPGPSAQGTAEGLASAGGGRRSCARYVDRIASGGGHAWGPEHPGTLVTGDAWRAGRVRRGDAAGAPDMLAELLPTVERVVGPEHPDTLDARANLAHWTKRAGPGP